MIIIIIVGKVRKKVLTECSSRVSGGLHCNISRKHREVLNEYKEARLIMVENILKAKGYMGDGILNRTCVSVHEETRKTKTFKKQKL